MNYEQLLENRNVLAFLLTIRKGEGTLGSAGYTTLYGGGQFVGLDKHPNQVVTAGRYTSTAAGAYQFLKRTWDDLVSKHPAELPDFSEASQDRGALYLIDERHALDDVLNGDISQAIAKCNKEWASLPGSPYGQPTQTMEAALKFYKTQGGTFRQVETQGQPMGALALVLPSLMAAVPDLIRAFGSPNASEVATRNQKAAQIVVDAALKATGAVNEQDLAQKLDSGDPVVKEQVKAAVAEVWYDITIDSGGIEAARSNDRQNDNFWKHPAIYVTLILVPLIYLTVMSVLGIHVPWGDGTLSSVVFPAEVQAMTVASIISGVLGGIMGFWLGTSFSSQRKTELSGGKV
jgi:muramidase (phage lysozyme)